MKGSVKIIKLICFGCGTKVDADDDYKPAYCCYGSQCGCMGLPINPVLCDTCERQITGQEIKAKKEFEGSFF